jgi:hypothetical protein
MTRVAAAVHRWVRARSAVQWVLAALVVVVLSGAGLTARNVLAAGRWSDTVPHDAAMEAALGIRVTRVAVVGDGGLITVSYQALDAEKAVTFQTDRTKTPRLESENRHGGTSRVSLMRQGHTMRAGQTYYFVYQNTAGAIRPHEHVSVVVGGYRLQHVPVL